MRLLIASLALLLAACGEPPEKLNYKPLAYSQLTAWPQGFASTTEVFTQTCHRFKKTNALIKTNEPRYGTHHWWRNFCEQLSKHPQPQQFFESQLQPIALTTNHNRSLFTAYYTPRVQGSRTRSASYTVPLRARPHDHITLNLKDFGLENPAFSGQLVGQLQDQRLKPYPTRETINQFQGSPLFWLNDPTDKFFLQIQGSGVIELPDGALTTVGFAAHNGHGYVPIGRILREWGELDPTNISMQSIRQWLQQNPQRHQELFHQNPRYIFFRELNGPAVGAWNHPLTPDTTLAIDPSYHPYGLPLWVNTTLSANNKPYQQLMLAHDTGAAITGPIRGDLYLGNTTQAEQQAGQQQASGQLYLFWPRLQPSLHKR